jgi:hypothetical protein
VDEDLGVRKMVTASTSGGARRLRCQEAGDGGIARGDVRCGPTDQTREGRRVHVCRFLSTRRVFSRNFRVGLSNPAYKTKIGRFMWMLGWAGNKHPKTD